MVVREGSNVSLRCAAAGSPEPTIAWRREGGEPIPLGTGQEGMWHLIFHLMGVCFLSEALDCCGKRTSTDARLNAGRNTFSCTLTSIIHKYNQQFLVEEKNGYVFRGNSIYRQLFYCYPYYFIYKDKYVPIENKFFSRFKFAFIARFISVQNVLQ